MALILLGTIRYRAERPETITGPLLLYVGLALSVADLMVYLVVSRVMATALRRRLGGESFSVSEGNTSLDAWYAGYQARLVIRLALLEGVCFFWIIVYFLQGWEYSLVVALVFLGGVLLHWPSRQRVERWVSQQREQAALEKAS
jgi:hypothetical protein